MSSPPDGWGRAGWGQLAWGEGEADATVPFTGWGRAGFGELAWDEGDVSVANSSGQVGSVTVSTNVNASVTGLGARGNPDLAGAQNAEYFVPTDSDSPNVTVMAFEDSTTVFSDGSSLGTITSAGGTLTVSASDYENKLISADKPITLQSSNNETTGVPTSWQGTSFGLRNTRNDVHLQFRSISGTATVEIFKKGSLVTTLSVPDNTTTIQIYAEDTDDPEYRIFSDLPIVSFLSRDASFNDTHPLFPASRELYGFASTTANIVKVENYGVSSSYAEFESDGTTSSTTTISTIRGTGGSSADFRGPSIRVVTAEDVAGFQIADGDGGEKTSFIPEGCFAHEFRLIEDAEFLAIMGAPGTNGRNINVFDSSGNLIDTVQLSGDTSSSNFPTKVQIVSNSTTDSNLTPIAKSYDLTAGVRIVSEVPVGVIVEDDSSNNEENLFGLRTFAGLVNCDANVSVVGVKADGEVGTSTVTAGSSVSVTGVKSDGEVGTSTVTAGASTPATGLSTDGEVGTSTVTADANVSVAGVKSDGEVGTSTVTVDITAPVTGLSTDGEVGSVTVEVSGATTVSVTGVKSDGEVGTSTVTVGANVSVTGVKSDAEVGAVSVNTEQVVSVSGLAASGQVNAVTVTAGAVVPETGLSASGQVNSATVTTDVTVDASGLAASGQVNAVTVTAGAVVPETGLSASGQVNAVTTNVTTNVSVTGVAASGQVNSATVTTDVNTNVTGVSSTGSVNSVEVVSDVSPVSTGLSASGQVNAVTVDTITPVNVSGLSASGQVNAVTVDTITRVITSGVAATGQVGSVTHTGSVDIPVVGVPATGQTGQIFLWGEIVPDQTANWNNISNETSTTYTEVVPSSSASWSAIVPSEETTYTDIAPNPGTIWKNEAA